VFIVWAYQTSQYVVPCGGIFAASGAALSQEVPTDFSVCGAARRHFCGKWRSSFAGSSDSKMNV
jgi:hypothetical protein